MNGSKNNFGSPNYFVPILLTAYSIMTGDEADLISSHELDALFSVLSNSDGVNQAEWDKCKFVTTEVLE